MSKTKTKANVKLNPVKNAIAAVKAGHALVGTAHKAVEKLVAKQKANASKIAELRAAGARIGTELSDARAQASSAKKDLVAANKALAAADREAKIAKKASKNVKTAAPAKTTAAPAKASSKKIKAKVSSASSK